MILISLEDLKKIRDRFRGVPKCLNEKDRLECPDCIETKRLEEILDREIRSLELKNQLEKELTPKRKTKTDLDMEGLNKEIVGHTPIVDDMPDDFGD